MDARPRTVSRYGPARRRRDHLSPLFCNDATMPSDREQDLVLPCSGDDGFSMVSIGDGVWKGGGSINWGVERLIHFRSLALFLYPYRR